MTQIPVFRAKIIDCNEYVEGNLLAYPKQKEMWIEDHTTYEDIHSIDPSTLSIHFPDMLVCDSDRLLPNGEKDLRIFASLSEDGKGGDILFGKGDFKYLIKYYKCDPTGFHLDSGLRWGELKRLFDHDMKYIFELIKIAGIKE